MPLRRNRSFSLSLSAVMDARWVRAVTVALTLAIAGEPLLVPAPAEARAGGSGGYSRPGIRTPSVAPGGGYRRPGLEGGGFLGGRSGADLGMSGRGSAEALQHYRSQMDRERWTAAPRTPPLRPETSRPRDWTPPPYAYGGPRSFGALDAMAMWFMLDTLSRSSSGAFFRQHQDDPGYRQWRQEAERRAEDDPELRAKLAALDRQLAQPAPPPARPEFPWAVAVVLLAVLGMLWRARRGLLPGGGMRQAKTGTMAPRPSPYRVGQTIPFDPAPFVLAGPSIKVTPPPDDGAGLISVAAVGVVTGDGDWHRLHLPDGLRLIQVHLDTAGGIDECRLYQRIDQVFPATAEDWAFWLGENDGLIGWPRFETKDGRAYDRVWGGGQRRSPPRALTETLTDLTGTRATRETAMLYGAPTGLAPPAPPTEYLWLATVERDGQAWIEMRAGIDINAASLG